MRVEIAVEINRARLAGLAFTPFRRFYDLAEMGTDRRCSCGAPATRISYCTLGDGRSVACPVCYPDLPKTTIPS